MPSTQLILASRSPRRAQLLREAGLTFVQATPPFDDPPHPETDGADAPQLVAMELAGRKAASMLDSPVYQDHTGAVVLAADTLVVYPDGRIVGTPTDTDQARAMISHFIGRSHEVITGVALFQPLRGSVTSFADTANVTVGHVSDDDLETYLATGEWRDKAGGYNLFDRQEAGWDITVDGDPSTVVGLPMRQVVRCLRDWGVEPATSGGAADTSVSAEHAAPDRAE